MPTTPKKPSFEDNYNLIDHELEKRRCKWTLQSISHIDFDDVKMIIVHHIYDKWYQYDPKFPLINWVSKIISNQIINISRNVYGSFKKPCLSCACSEGSDTLCRIFGTQNNKCPILKHWMETKKQKHDIELPLSLDYHNNEASQITQHQVDILKSADNLHKYMHKFLKPNEWKIYKMLYVEGKSEEDVAKAMHYVSNEKSRKAGYRWIYMIKKKILELARKVVYSDNFDMQL